ncbi:MAG: YlbF family regulator [Anaerolineales bacterium]|nr:YlbF family regulator [Anaerolineales bacterium]
MDKDIEMTSNLAVAINISPVMLEATQTLAQALLQSEPFIRYQEADRKLNADQDAMQLLADLSEAQSKIRKQQASNAVSESDLSRLRELHNTMRTNDTILAYGKAQQEAIAFLQEVNQEISSLLGFDFASLTRRSGVC